MLLPLTRACGKHLRSKRGQRVGVRIVMIWFVMVACVVSAGAESENASGNSALCSAMAENSGEILGPTFSAKLRPAVRAWTRSAGSRMTGTGGRIKQEKGVSGARGGHRRSKIRDPLLDGYQAKRGRVSDLVLKDIAASGKASGGRGRSTSPLAIHAKGGVRFCGQTNTCTAVGDVSVHKGDLYLQADQLTAEFVMRVGKRRLAHLWARDHVRVDHPMGSACGQQLLYRHEDQTWTLLGPDVKLWTQDCVLHASQKVFYQPGQGQIAACGRVRIQTGGLSISHETDVLRGFGGRTTRKVWKGPRFLSAALSEGGSQGTLVLESDALRAQVSAKDHTANRSLEEVEQASQESHRSGPLWMRADGRVYAQYRDSRWRDKKQSLTVRAAHADYRAPAQGARLLRVQGDVRVTYGFHKAFAPHGSVNFSKRTFHLWGQGGQRVHIIFTPAPTPSVDQASCQR